MIEIERKFLVKSMVFKSLAFNKNDIEQGYICNDIERTVRVRTKGNQGYLTIKGKGNETNLSRFEWEKPIPPEDAKALLKLCKEGIISKTRYEIRSGKHIIEVDEFHDQNQGLYIAEIELESETEHYDKPDWLGDEVTDDKRYYNAFISQNPYKNW